MLDKMLFTVSMLALFAVLAFVAARVWRRPLDGRTLVLAMALWTLNYVVLMSGRALQDAMGLDLRWNWVGKVLAIGVTLLLISKMSRVSWRDAGVTLRHVPGSLLPASIGILLMAAVACIAYKLGGGTGGLEPETLAYQLFMPSIEEELFYRGLFFVVLARIFSEPVVAGSNAVTAHITLMAMLFGLGHALAFNNGAPIFDWMTFVFTGLIGYVLGWARQRTGSIAVPMVGHTLVNVGTRLM